MSAPKLAANRSPNWAFMQRFEIPDYDTDGIYLTRWRIVQTPLFGVYVHRFDGPDPRPTLHDHPWNFLSIVLRGGYAEFTPGDREGIYAVPRLVRRFNRKRATDLHWISQLNRTPSWTLMFVGRRKRVWGYFDRDGTWTRFDEHPYNEQFIAALERRATRLPVGINHNTQGAT